MTSLDFVQPLYEYFPLETGSDGHMANFWISLAFEHPEESDDEISEGEHENTSVEASLDSLENGSKVDIPQTIANTESKPVHSSSMTQAGGQQLVELAGSRSSLTETSHCKVVPGICTIGPPQSEHSYITNSACLTVRATQQKPKRRIPSPIKGENKRRRLTHKGTQDTVHHSQVVLERDPEVFVRLLGGQVVALGDKSTTLMPIQWNRRRKQHVAETADDIWSSEDHRDFTWLSVTLQVGGDGHAVTLAYEDEMWIGWDAVTAAAIAVTADALAVILLKPGKMNCVVWKETYTD